MDKDTGINAMGKYSEGKGHVFVGCPLEREFRDGFTERVMSEQIPGGREGAALADSLGGKHSKQKEQPMACAKALLGWECALGSVYRAWWDTKEGRNLLYLEGPGGTPQRRMPNSLA